MLERDLRRVTTGPGCRITALMSFPLTRAYAGVANEKR
jgi:hypothetical protein